MINGNHKSFNMAVEALPPPITTTMKSFKESPTKGGRSSGRTTLCSISLLLLLALLTVSFRGATAKVRNNGRSNDVAENELPPLASTQHLLQTTDSTYSGQYDTEHLDAKDHFDAYGPFDSMEYVMGENHMDYGRGYGYATGNEGWSSVTMVDGDLEPLEEEIPYFDEDSPTEVTAAVGAPAHIPCIVRNLGSKSLSWIRHRDLHVLTVGSFTFTNDHRFSAHRDQLTGDWVLVLRHPLPSDSGHYVCSISTKPVKTHTVKLSVVVPAAEIVSGQEVYLDYGSTLNLTCLIHFSPTPPEFVLWYHRDKLVNYGGRGGRIEVDTVHQDTTTRSSLLVRNATQWHSGRYSCKPSNARMVNILVHVLKSETPAAMQTTNNHCGAVAPTTALTSSALLALLALLLFCSTNGLNYGKAIGQGPSDNHDNHHNQGNENNHDNQGSNDYHNNQDNHHNHDSDNNPNNHGTQSGSDNDDTHGNDENHAKQANNENYGNHGNQNNQINNDESTNDNHNYRDCKDDIDIQDKVDKTTVSDNQNNMDNQVIEICQDVQDNPNNLDNEGDQSNHDEEDGQNNLTDQNILLNQDYKETDKYYQDNEVDQCKYNQYNQKIQYNQSMTTTKTSNAFNGQSIRVRVSSFHSQRAGVAY